MTRNIDDETKQNKNKTKNVSFRLLGLCQTLYQSIIFR